jgi:tetratricopeptide (TPR) repeat protein
MSRVEELPDDFDEKPTQQTESPAAKAAREQHEADMAGDSIDLDAANRLKSKANELYTDGLLEEALAVYERALARCPTKPHPKPKAPKPAAKPAATTTSPATAGWDSDDDNTSPAAAAAASAARSSASAPATRDTDGKLSTNKVAPATEAAEAAEEEEEEKDTTDYTLTAQLHANIGLVLMKLNRNDDAVRHLSDAVRHKGDYDKAYLRRATCYWDLGQWSSCSADYEKCAQLGMPFDAALAERRRVAKQKAEEEMGKMLGQLKDLGNMFLGKFGLSTDNFKFDKDPKSGGYSMRFEQGAPGAKPPQ